VLCFPLKFPNFDTLSYKNNAVCIFLRSFILQMEHVWGIDSREIMFKTTGNQNVESIFDNDQFLRVQHHRFIRINYMNLLLSLY